MRGWANNISSSEPPKTRIYPYEGPADCSRGHCWLPYLQPGDDCIFALKVPLLVPCSASTLRQSKQAESIIDSLSSRDHSLPMLHTVLLQHHHPLDDAKHEQCQTETTKSHLRLGLSTACLQLTPFNNTLTRHHEYNNSPPTCPPGPNVSSSPTMMLACGASAPHATHQNPFWRLAVDNVATQLARGTDGSLCTLFPITRRLLGDASPLWGLYPAGYSVFYCCLY